VKHTRTFYGKLVGHRRPVVAVINWEIDAAGELHMIGECGASSGQAQDAIRAALPKVDGTTPRAQCAQMLDVWDRWHLNHMRAGCEHQRAAKWGRERLSEPCPVCGYRWGHAWLKEELPPEVVKIVNEWVAD